MFRDFINWKSHGKSCSALKYFVDKLLFVSVRIKIVKKKMFKVFKCFK